MTTYAATIHNLLRPTQPGWPAYTELLYQLRQQFRRDIPVRSDRTGVGTHASFGHTLRFSWAESGNNRPLYSPGAVTQFRLPLLGLREIHFKSVLGELLWFLSGSTYVSDLHRLGVTFWDEWQKPDGSFGPIYGHQWRAWNSPYGDFPDKGIDQVQALLNGLVLDPYGRRHIITAWNPSDFAKQALPACHVFAQWFRDDSDGLHCHMYQRSADIFLGVPYNIASYALLTAMIAHEIGCFSRSLTVSYGDIHLYANHVDAVDTMLDGYVSPYCYSRLSVRDPLLTFDGRARPLTLKDWKPSDFTLTEYHPRMRVTAPVAK